MIFETLHESAERGELMLIDGGVCHWHLRRDGQLTIREIISTKPGAGSQMFNRLRYTVGATSLFAKCPMDLPANSWYAKKGFHVERIETTPSGRRLMCWRLNLEWKPSRNISNNIELIYCAANNKPFMESAIDAGWLPGAQLPGTIYYRPYFVDQNYKNPLAWDTYLPAVQKWQPYMATVTDWTPEYKRDEIIHRAEQIAPHCQVIIIIPKIPGTIDQIPETVGEKPVRLGYSVETTHGHTVVEIVEFGKRPVHLLGGDPREQIRLAQYMNVVSADTNYHQERAVNGGQFLAYNRVSGARRTTWPTLREAGLYTPEKEGNLRAMQLSFQTGKRLWEQYFESHQVAEKDAPPYTLKLAI